MFSPVFNSDSLSELDELFTESGILEKPRQFPLSAQEQDARNEELQQTLQSYFSTVEKGYQRMLAEGEKLWKEHLPEYVLSAPLREAINDPKEFQRVMTEQGTLQKYFGYTEQQIKNIYQIIVDFQEQRHWKEAAEMLTFLLYLNPYIAAVWQGLGECWEQTQQWDDAEFAYTSAINCEPLNPECYRSTCRCLLETKQYERAEELLNYGLSLLANEPVSEETKATTETLNGALAYVQSLQTAGR